jgi:hypothetical protein
MRAGDLLVCGTHERRLKLFGNADWNGLDYLDVLDDQQTLCVHFFGPVPEGLTPANICIEGGRRIRGLRVTEVKIHRSNDPEVDDCLRITIDRPGDFSTYRLCLVDGGERCDPPGRPPRGIDPRFACLDFTFKVNCPSDLDCRPATTCPTPSTPPPDINYLAKDYSTFRQLILDRLALIMPGWRERHVPDIGITLVELLAYIGDYLSYYQDAVATEAYLDTARQRISVRRHARLVDYRLHEGVNARAWVTVETATDLDPLPARGVYFITGFPDIKAGSGRVVKHADLDLVPRTAYEVFEPLAPGDASLHFFATHSRMRFYTWGEHECCLAKGATRATLVDGEPRPAGQEPAATPEQTSSKGAASTSSGPNEPQRILNLQPGDVLVFEEALGPNTGNAADADPSHRHAVRLTSVTRLVDELLGHTPVLDIEWADEDALPFSLCLSSRLPAPDCRRIADVSVARGNVVLVDHGRTEQQDLGPVEEQASFGDCRCDGTFVEWTTVPAPFHPSLEAAPLTFAEAAPDSAIPASRATQQEVRQALPAVRLAEYRKEDTIGQNESRAASGWRWQAREDLLSSSAEDRHFVAEIDDEGQARLRFGNGELGRQPASGVRLQAIYRTGNGPDGNVGRETITYLVLRDGSLSADAILPTNPLPAVGGIAPEPLAEAKLVAPHAFRERLERAVTGADYGTLARRHPRVHRVLGELLWTGSWYEARVSIDPAGAVDPAPALLDAVHQLLHRYRRIGHDLAVVAARYVPLDIALEICVCAQAENAPVKAALLDAFSNRTTRRGTLGFFHPDQLSFADGVHLSRLIATAQSVPGVELARVVRCQRLAAPAGDELETGVLVLDGMEVARLDNDPDFPENGMLELIVRGGR